METLLECPFSVIIRKNQNKKLVQYSEERIQEDEKNEYSY